MWYIFKVPLFCLYILAKCIAEIIESLLRSVIEGACLYPFRPLHWAQGPFIQTLLVELCSRPKRRHMRPVQQELLYTADGQAIVLEWIRRVTTPKATIVLLHGIGCDCAQACYFTPWYSEFADCNVLVMCRRGHHRDYPLMIDDIREVVLPTHADVDDIGMVLEHIAQKQVPIYLVGYSGGGHHALAYAASLTPHPLVQGVVSVSSGVNLIKLAKHLRASPLMDTLLGHGLSDMYKRNMHVYKKMFQVERTHPFMRATELEAKIAAYHGVTLEQYWGNFSVHGHLSKIQVPTLILMSKDDPVLPADTEQEIRFAKNPHITLITTEKGGHVAWITHQYNSWCMEVIHEFVTKSMACYTLSNEFCNTFAPSIK